MCRASTMAGMNSSVWDAVIFDYGGVLCYPPSHDDVAEYAGLSGLDKATFFNLYNETRDYYGRAADGYEDRWQQAARASGLEIDPIALQAFIAKESDLWTRPNSGVIQLARDIKAEGCKVAILSNMTFDLLQILRTKFDWLNEFDVRIWSCEYGCAKPDAPIYHSCLKALGSMPDRTLFFDDRSRNVEGAKLLGIDAHVFESATQARLVFEAGIQQR